MGIQGLIPFLEKSSRKVNISQYSGCTVAVDAYCWLHKGAFSCADKLARGDKTDAYVTYCMKYVNMLLSHNIKPILVFDGRHLPAKADTEKKRRQNRDMNRRRAAELLRQDKPSEARSFLQRCVDVTHVMALQLMQECRSRNVDCITAPYEADAQLGYLNINNIAHIVITEDSDLLLFGCTRVIFKLDLNGNGLLVEQDRLHLAMGISRGCFSMDKFRHMCILSGCDYLPSLPGIGLVKACRFVKSTVDPDIHRALSRLGGHLNMSLAVPLEYRNQFVAADAMFRHQPVYDPVQRCLVPLTPPAHGASPLPLLTQETLSPQQLLDLALGNLDPFTLEKLDNWTPDNAQPTGGRTNSWKVKPVAAHKSIWSADYQPSALVVEQPDPCKVQRVSTSGHVVEQAVHVLQLPAKRPLQSPEEEMTTLRAQFTATSQPCKKPRFNDEDILDLLEKSDKTPPKSETSKDELMESPKKTHVNPFSKVVPPSGNKFSGLSKLAQFRKTAVSETNVVHSRYFSNSQPANKPVDIKPEGSILKEIGNATENETTPIINTTAEDKNTGKLTDSGISTLIEDLCEDEKKNQSGGKENVSDATVKLKRESSFKWKTSLADMFGFKSKDSPGSTTAMKNKSLSPSKAENKCEAKLECPNSPPPTKQENKSAKRNPFAKVSKVEESLGSQGSSQSDTLTPESSDSENFTTSSCSASARPQVKVGLSKRQSSGCQRSLLSMFAFTPKTKLQR